MIKYFANLILKARLILHLLLNLCKLVISIPLLTMTLNKTGICALVKNRMMNISLKVMRLITVAALTIILILSIILFSSKSSARVSKDTILQGVAKLLGSLQTTQRKKIVGIGDEYQPRYSISNDGFLQHIGAPPLFYFPVINVVRDNPGETGYNFIQENLNLFCARSSSVDFSILRIRAGENRSYVRYIQTYKEIPVFGAQIIVQVNDIGGVESVMSDLSHNTDLLDRGVISIIPTLSSAQIINRVIDLFSQEDPNMEIETTVPILKVFDPAILDCIGTVRLVWEIKATSTEGIYVNEHLLIDAHNSEIVRRYPMNIFDRIRFIYDSNNDRLAGSGTLILIEGLGPSGIAEVDNAYRFAGDAYDFFRTHHGRDSIDHDGMVIRATVRFCKINPNTDCPYGGAFWNSGSKRMYFGDGVAVDDIVGHEYTHGVTQHESNLIYENHSGAINESFSDIWGEFIDLGNGVGTDTAAVRWIIGEDRRGGAIRDMQDPTNANHPDCLHHPNFIQPINNPSAANDYGGVHTNCGVNNKLCYLLTDGDTFRGYTIQGMGVDRVADLYYEVNSGLLLFAASYTILYYALRQAAINLGWNPEERNNLYRACKAVEIAEENAIYVDGGYTGFMEFGTQYFPYDTVIEGYRAINPGDRLNIKSGLYDEIITFKKIMEINGYDGIVIIGK